MEQFLHRHSHRHHHRQEEDVQIVKRTIGTVKRKNDKRNVVDDRREVEVPEGEHVRLVGAEQGIIMVVDRQVEVERGISRGVQRMEERGRGVLQGGWLKEFKRKFL